MSQFDPTARHTCTSSLVTSTHVKLSSLSIKHQLSQTKSQTQTSYRLTSSYIKLRALSIITLFIPTTSHTKTGFLVTSSVKLRGLSIMSLSITYSSFNVNSSPSNFMRRLQSSICSCTKLPNCVLRLDQDQSKQMGGRGGRPI